MDDQDTSEEQRHFSLSAARHIVRDLFTPQPSIYWADFLSSIVGGHVAFGLSRRLEAVLPLIAAQALPDWLLLATRCLLFTVACVLYFRATNFIHEVIHLPARKFRLFKLTWNLLCGIPFLTPSFTHEEHLDHHRRAHFGTKHDGEYLELRSLNRWVILVYLSQVIWAPPLALIRFGLLTPLSWLSVRIRDWVHRHFSSLVMDPRYLRPLPSPEQLRLIRLQEGLCFAWILGVAIICTRLSFDRFVSFLAVAYLMSCLMILMNALRTLAAHRYSSNGEPSTFIGQLIDSVNIDSRQPWDLIVAPVGLRYHATHHLFPGIPYHNLPAAHRRLLQHLPADSLYRVTNEPSLFAALRKLWRREEVGLPVSLALARPPVPTKHVRRARARFRVRGFRRARASGT